MTFFKWPGFNEKGTVIIPLAGETFSLTEDNITIFGEIFKPKEELHITLIGTDLGSILLCRIKQDQSVNQLLAKTFEAIDWSFKQTGPVHILARTEQGTEQKSIIMLLEMPGVTEFYQQLKATGIIDTGTPVPPAHVTLYTQNCAQGIGVASNVALERLTMNTLSLSTFNRLRE